MYYLLMVMMMSMSATYCMQKCGEMFCNVEEERALFAMTDDEAKEYLEEADKELLPKLWEKVFELCPEVKNNKEAFLYKRDYIRDENLWNRPMMIILSVKPHDSDESICVCGVDRATKHVKRLK